VPGTRLARNQELRGRVTVKFVIDRQGRVRDAELANDSSSSALLPDPATYAFFKGLGFSEPAPTSGTEAALPDSNVIACILERYRSMTFPPPDGGIVTVVYPVKFEPSKEPSP
jgi:TonB family protein